MTTTIDSTSLELYIDAAGRQGEAFAKAARACDLDADIAACPGWAARDLVTHVGLVHLWAAANIAYPSDQWLSVKGFDDLRPYWPELTDDEPCDDELADWYRSTLHNLIDVLGSTPHDHQCLTFLPAPSPLVMWARRQASEIAVHRYDLEASQGRSATFDPAFAADMLEEVLVGFASRIRVRDLEEAKVIEVHAEDTNDRYSIDMSPAGIHTTTESAPSDLTVRGLACDLYLYFWNRPAGPSIRLDGQVAAMQTWRQLCEIRWR